MTKLWLETVRGREAREAWNRGQGRIEDESLWREKNGEQSSRAAKQKVKLRKKEKRRSTDKYSRCLRRGKD